MYSWIGHVLARLERGLLAVCVVLIAAMTAIMTLLVITRNFLGFSYPWSEEITRFMMIWLIFLGASVLVNRDDHIALAILPEALSGCPRFLLMAVLRSITLVVLVLLFWQAVLIIGLRAQTLSPALGLSLAWIYTAIPVGAAFMVIFQAYRLWTDWRILRAKEV